MNARCMLVPLAAVCLTGCLFEGGGPMQHDSQTIDRDKSELVHVNLDLGGGTMKVGGSAGKLAALDFNYGANATKPEVQYGSAAGRGSLTIRQPGNSSTLNHSTKEWDLHLSNDVPMEIEVHLGGGERT